MVRAAEASSRRAKGAGHERRRFCFHPAVEEYCQCELIAEAVKGSRVALGKLNPARPLAGRATLSEERKTQATRRREKGGGSEV